MAVHRVVFVNPVVYDLVQKTAVYPEANLLLEIQAQQKIGKCKDNASFAWFAKGTKAVMAQCEIVYAIACGHTIVAGFDENFLRDDATCNVEPAIRLRAKGVTQLIESNDFNEFVASAAMWIAERSGGRPVEIDVVHLPSRGVDAIPEAHEGLVVVWLPGPIAGAPGHPGHDWRDVLIETIRAAQASSKREDGKNTVAQPAAVVPAAAVVPVAAAVPAAAAAGDHFDANARALQQEMRRLKNVHGAALTLSSAAAAAGAVAALAPKDTKVDAVTAASAAVSTHVPLVSNLKADELVSQLLAEVLRRYSTRQPDGCACCGIPVCTCNGATETCLHHAD